MSRINTNVPSLIAQRILKQNNDVQSASLERLSTGLRINRGSDDPAGLIASENLRAERTGIQASIDNATRASNIISTAEGGLNEVSALLNELSGLVNLSANVAGLSTEEIAANQLQVDSILSTVNRIADATSFQGKKLLDGQLDYDLTGLNTTDITSVRINGARQISNVPTNVLVEVVTSAQSAELTRTSAGGFSAPFVIELSGNLGAQQVSFSSAVTNTQIATAINAVAAATGVSATLSGATLRISSREVGASQFVSVRTITGSFVDGTDSGRDAVVRVNGNAATSDGLNVTLRSAFLDVQLKLGSAINSDGASTSFQIAGGGATFALGTKVTENDKVSIGIGSVSSANLGDATNGFLSTLGSGGPNSLSGGNLVAAQRIVDSAIRQVSQLRGRLGAFVKYTLDATVRSQSVALENANAAESAIRDTDFASETSRLTRAQILSQATSNVLAQANSQPQSVLSLLQG
jgi:flagellin